MSADEVEDLEAFRLRARAWIHEHLKPVGAAGRLAPGRPHRRGGAGRRRARPRGAAHALRRRPGRHLRPAGLRRPGPDAGPPAGAQPGADRLRVPDAVPGARRSRPCASVLLDFGTEEQKRRHIPAILKGEELWMQLLSEPSGGSDVAGALTTAVRDGDEWVLNGSKVWTTGAWWSDWGLCLARTNWDVPKHRGLTVFMLPVHQPGIEVHRIEMLNGNKEFCQEFLTDVRVPDTRPDRRGGRRLDRRHAVDVPRADALQLAARHGAGRHDAQRRQRPACSSVARDAGRIDDPRGPGPRRRGVDARRRRRRAQGPGRSGHRHRGAVGPGLGGRPALRRDRRHPAHHHRLRAGRRRGRRLARRRRRDGRTAAPTTSCAR